MNQMERHERITGDRWFTVEDIVESLDSISKIKTTQQSVPQMLVDLVNNKQGKNTNIIPKCVGGRGLMLRQLEMQSPGYRDGMLRNELREIIPYGFSNELIEQHFGHSTSNGQFEDDPSQLSIPNENQSASPECSSPSLQNGCCEQGAISENHSSATNKIEFTEKFNYPGATVYTRQSNEEPKMCELDRIASLYCKVEIDETQEQDSSHSLSDTTQQTIDMTPPNANSTFKTEPQKNENASKSTSSVSHSNSPKLERKASPEFDSGSLQNGPCDDSEAYEKHSLSTQQTIELTPSSANSTLKTSSQQNQNRSKSAKLVDEPNSQEYKPLDILSKNTLENVNNQQQQNRLSPLTDSSNVKHNNYFPRRDSSNQEYKPLDILSKNTLENVNNQQQQNRLSPLTDSSNVKHNNYFPRCDSSNIERNNYFPRRFPRKSRNALLMSLERKNLMASQKQDSQSLVGLKVPSDFL